MSNHRRPVRAETVGSLLRPKRLAQVIQHADVSSPPAELRQLQDDAVLAAIDLQQEAGLDIITDGEARRYSWAQTPYFLDCFERREGDGPPLDWRGGSAPDASIAHAAYPAVVRRVSTATRNGDMAAEYAFLARHARIRTKYSLAAPSYHRRYWSERHSKDAYTDCSEFLREVRDYEREVVERLVEIGCDYIQLDAPNYGSLCDPDTRRRMEEAGQDPEEQLAFDAELDNSLFVGLDGVTTALHICRGNGPGGRWHSTGGYAAISAQLFPRLDFDVLLLEYDSDRAGDFAPLADARSGTTAVLGLLTTKDGRLEDEVTIETRIAEAARVKPLSELALSTQCGFASVAGGNPLSEEEQRVKLELVARVARRTWNGDT